MRMHGKLKALILGAVLTASCDFYEFQPSLPDQRPDRQVTIFVAEGFNNLSYDILDNIKSITPLPLDNSNSVMVAVCHFTAAGGDYKTQTSPFIARLRSDWSGNPVYDTLKVMEKGARLTDRTVLREALEFVCQTFPAERYGMVLSSHGTGWLPERYYNAPTAKRGQPRTKSFGCEAAYDKAKLVSLETDIRDLKAAIPMRLDYIIFDACLMGCVEVAWQLRDITGHIGFSQTEVLSYGFDYSTFSKRFLMSVPADPKGWCEDYYVFYNKKSGSSKSATISYVNCSTLDSLASTCRRLNGKYDINSLGSEDVQTFMRISTPWFFDLEDIYAKAGADSSDLASLRSALDLCVEYKAHTDHFLEIPIRTNCGLSMFLPSTGSANLRSYYKYLDWNISTELVK